MLIRLLSRYLRPYTLQVAIVGVLVLAQSIANLYLPNLNADIINNGVAKGDIHYIWVTGGVMLALTVGLTFVAIAGVYWASRTAMGLGRDLRAAVFERVQEYSAREMSQLGTPSLITRNTNDVQQIQLFLQMGLTVMASAPIMGVGGIIMALREDVRLSTLLVVSVPAIGTVITIMLIKAVPLFGSMQSKIDRINQVLREQIMGVRVIRAFVRTPSERERFEAANFDLTATALYVNRIFVAAFPANLVIMNLSSVAALWFGGHLVASGQMPIGNLTAFLAYILQILFSVMAAVMMFILVPRAEASAGRIGEVLGTEPTIAEPEHPVEPLLATGVVELRHVTFGYPGGERPVLQDISLELRPGETVAIIGGTGAGKTTLVNLIPRFLDVTSGQLLIDGVDVREQEQDRLWSRVGLVPQRAYLFGGTVASNLRLGREEATDAELWQALEVAQGADFVSQMAGQLEAPIDQGGTNVSGGQRQRLAIARALVKRPAVYLFDDCFSALDAATDARLRAALPAVTRGAAVLIVSQRVSSIQHADRIVVMDEGRIVGTGTHEELLSTCDPYREIVESQLGVEAA